MRGIIGTGTSTLAAVNTEEVPLSGGYGRRVAVLCAVALVAAAALVALGASDAARRATWAAAAVLLVAGLTGLRGLVRVEQGNAVVVQRFGAYVGTIRSPGLHWALPGSKARAVSAKVRTHETAPLKVNDSDGNPVEISVAVVWRVSNTARALFFVDDFAQYVAMQSSAAVRHVAAGYRFDNQGGRSLSLSANTNEVAERLSADISRRVEPAGVTILESQVVRIAYAPEVAQALLRRQQAAAIVAARQQIVEGAVGMVELALQRLTEGNFVALDEERKAAMVSNLLVVLCSDHPTEPMVNAGSLYH
ncbi:MAG TPA: SPFH domain-containing protein [Acidimicrobiales bacterium]|nr:SPFH domain-containing protein [Acidimicrobiales bacterium]